MGTRAFMIDVQDSHVRYEPSSSWSFYQPANEWSYAVPAKLQPFHRYQYTLENASFSFDFEGTTCVMCTNLALEDPDPNLAHWSASCAIDGGPVMETNETVTEFEKCPCRMGFLSQGKHTLEVNVTFPANTTSPSERNPFYLNYLAYVPLPSTPAEDGIAYVFTEDFHAEIGFSEDGSSSALLQPGVTMSFMFRGKAISFVGSADYPISGYYTIDDGSRFDFNPISLPDRILFSANDLSTDEVHVVKVTRAENISDSSDVQRTFSVDYMFIEPNSQDDRMDDIAGTEDELRAAVGSSDQGSSNATDTSSGPEESDTPADDSSGGGSQNIGAIVGGAVGGVVVLACIVGLCIWLLIRRRRKRKEDARAEEIRQMTAPVTPFFSSSATSPLLSNGMPSSPLQPALPGQHPLGSESGYVVDPLQTQTFHKPRQIGIPPAPEIMHEDSGLRGPQVQPLEYPPMYTRR